MQRLRTQVLVTFQEFNFKNYFLFFFLSLNPGLQYSGPRAPAGAASRAR